MLRTATGGNALLSSMPERDLASLADSSKLVSFNQDETLYVQGDRVEHIYFPVECIFSTVAVMSDGASAEVSMAGREGATGVNAVFGDYESRNWTRALIGGAAVRVGVAALKELCARSEKAQGVMMGSCRMLLAQVSQRVICNCRHTLLQRLATWILMVHDRAGSDDLTLTQEMIAGRLGARRAGVTQAARLLLLSGGLRYSRGKVHISDRALIEQTACECYRVHADNFRDTGQVGAKSDYFVTQARPLTGTRLIVLKPYAAPLTKDGRRVRSL